MNKKIYLTVDTECHDIRKINQYIYGKGKYSSSGIDKILRIGQKYNIPINFFLDVGECKRYGEQYAKDIIKLIHSYDQPVYFHFHPNFISNDDKKTYLWEYSDNEQRRLIEEGYQIYKKYCHEGDRLFFRAGRYGVNKYTYQILNSLGVEVVDLSYFAGNMKMCHVSTDEIKTQNANTKYLDVIVLPNTTYIGLDFFGKKHTFLLNCANSTRDEFFTFIRKTSLKNVVYTMHSWDLINKWFFLPNYVGEDKNTIRKFEACIKEAKANGFSFEKMDQFVYSEYPDELLNLCTGINGRMKSLLNNFLRFQKISKLNKKYFLLYSFFYMIIFGILVKISSSSHEQY